MAGTLILDTIKSSTSSPPAFQNTSGTQIGTLCRAWVNFDGTATPITIRASFNVSSITDNGTGDYTVNFTSAMPDANYSVSSCSGRIGRLITGNGPNDGTQPNWTTTTCRINATTEIGTLTDQIQISVSIFR